MGKVSTFSFPSHKHMKYCIILPRNKEENKIYRGAVSFILNVSHVANEKGTPPDID